jgi:hypothetical protein
MYVQAQAERCGDGEPFSPMDADVLFGQQDIVLRGVGSNGDTVTGPEASDVFRRREGVFLDFPGDPRSPGCTYEQDFIRFGGPDRPVTYAHVAGERGKSGLAVQYWFFYYFNDWNNRHEGDWEMIQLVFDEDTAEEALESEPTVAIYSQHATAERADWDDSKVRKEDGRPVVYPSAGSHASYFSPAVYVGKGESGTGFGCDDATGPHRRLDLEAVAVPSRVTDRESEFAWLTFDGRWGQQLGGHNNGPTGPTAKASWATPLTFAENVDLTSNVTVPDGRVLGLSVTDVFCGLVENGSKVLFAASNRMGLSIVLLGAVLGTVAVSSSRILRDIRHARRADLRAPTLIQPRTLGEIVVSVWEVYRQHWITWVAIAAGLLPVAALLSALAALILENPPIETVLEVTDRRGFAVMLALIYGIGTNLPFLLVATSGVIAGMRQYRDARRPSFVEAYKEILREAKDLLLARLTGLGIVTVLLLSVVGIPWGIRRIVDWYFAEEAVIMDRHPWRGALGESRRLVKGDWWRTFGITFLLGFLSAVAAPFLAAVLMLLTDIPIWLLNAMCSIAYVLIVPFVGIALTFLYWDLKARDQEEASRGASAG